MVKNLIQKGDVRLATDLQSNPRIYKEIELIFNKHLKNTNSLRGTAAVKDLFKSMKEVTKDFRRTRQVGLKDNHDGLVSLVDDFRTTYEQSFDEFAKKTASRSDVMKAIQQTRSEYRMLNDKAQKAIDISNSYRKNGLSAVESKLNTISADRASRQAFLNEIEESTKVLSKYSPQLQDNLDRIKDLVTAAQFHPRTARTSPVDAGIAYSLSTAAAGYALAGPLAIAGGIGGGSMIQRTLKSAFAPRALFDRLGKQQAKSELTKQTAVKTGYDVLNTIRQGVRDPRARALTPVLLNKWMDSQDLQEQTSQQLNQQLQQVTGQ